MALPLDIVLTPEYLDALAELLVKSFRESGERRLGYIRLNMGERVTIEQFESGAFMIRGREDIVDQPGDGFAEHIAESFGVLLLVAARAIRVLKA